MTVMQNILQEEQTTSELIKKTNELLFSSEGMKFALQITLPLRRCVCVCSNTLQFTI